MSWGPVRSRRPSATVSESATGGSGTTGETLIEAGSSSGTRPFTGTLLDEATAALLRGHLYQLRGSALLLEQGAGAGDVLATAIGGVSISIVPEPGSAAPTALGLLVLAYARDLCRACGSRLGRL